MKVSGLFLNSQETINLPAGSVLFKEGDIGKEMYGIVEGEVALSIQGRVVRTLGPDDVFGEMALVDSSPRSATATATKDSVLAVINQHRFLFLVQETPMFALQVMSEMGSWLREGTHLQS